MTFHRAASTHLHRIVMIWCCFAVVSAWGEAPPPAPAGQILDQASALLPERAAALSEKLQTASRERGIWIYIVTVHTLDVPPSRQRHELENQGHFFADAWIRGKIGAVLLVDDESGYGIVVASPETDRRFPPVQRNMLMADSLRSLNDSRLLREKVETTALALCDVLGHLQEQEQRAIRRNRLVYLAVFAVILFGLAALVAAWWLRPKR